MVRSVILALLLFVDPLIVSRVFIGSDNVGAAIYAALGSVGLYFVVRAGGLRAGLRDPWFFLFLAYGIASVGLRIRADQHITFLLQHVVVVYQGIVIYALLKVGQGGAVFAAYLVAAVLHLLGALPIFASITETLAVNTAYDVGEYSVGFTSRRATGFFNSPGQLSLFAAGGVALGLGSFQQSLWGARQALALISLLLGIFALSRSFVMTCLALTVVFLIRANVKGKLYVVAIVLSLLPFAMRTDAMRNYTALIVQRLEGISDLQSNDRLAGETGLIEALKAIKHAPFVGSMVAADNRSLMAWNGEILVRPHTGIVQVFAFYGLLFGAPMIALLMRAGWLATGMFQGRQGPVRSGADAAMLGFFAVNVVCLVEPLLETSVYFYFLFLILASTNRKALPRPLNIRFHPKYNSHGGALRANRRTP